MLARIFPAVVDNRFRGYAPALWLFVPLALMKLALGVAHIVRADGGAQSVSTIPLDTYPAGAAQNIIGLMARMGLEQFLLGLVFFVVLLRYRALLPLMYLIAVLHFIGGKAIGAMKPLALAGVSGAATMHLIIGAISVVGLVLSLMGRNYRNN
ncbi:hypothetical protein [Lysobacter tyrosinilyticus]